MAHASAADQDRADPSNSGTGSDEDSVTEQAQDARESTWVHAFARFGLGSRALVYGLFSVLVVQIAVHGRSASGSDTDQKSSLKVLGGSAIGVLLLLLLALAVVSYSLWRWSEAWLGTADPGDSTMSRLQAVIEGVAYLPFGYAALGVAFGDSQAAQSGSKYRGMSARVLGSGWGQVAVGVLGAVVIGLGVFFVVQGIQRTFMGHFDFDDMPQWAQRLTRYSGSIGCIGRGIMFALAGVLVVYAAFTKEPRKAGGIDAALDALAREPYGSYLLIAAAVGFVSFAVFALCEAIWRRI